MVPHSLFVAAARAPDRTSMELAVTARALAVNSTFEPYALRCYGVEGILMAGRTAHGLRGIRRIWPIMMTHGTIICNTGMLFVHEPNRPVKIVFLVEQGAIHHKEVVLRRNIFGRQPVGKTGTSL